MISLTLIFTLFVVTAITSKCSAQTTTSSSSSSAPTLAPGNSDFELVGCYTELSASSNSRALGRSNEYGAPLFAAPDTVDVPSCLEACSSTLAPRGGGIWKYAAVENSRECFCGLTLSNASLPVDAKLCSLPCAGNELQSCGGFGLFTLYQRVNSSVGTSSMAKTTETKSSAISTSSSTSSPPSTLTTSSSQSPSPRAKSRLSNPQTAGIISGTILGSLLLFSLLLYCIFRHSRLAQQSPEPPLSTEATTISFVIGANLRRGNAIRRPKTPCPTPSLSSPLDANPDLTTPSTAYIAPLTIRSPRQERTHRESLNTWKRGTVPPLSPNDVGRSIEMQCEPEAAELDVGNPPPTSVLIERLDEPGNMNGVESPLGSPRSLVSDFSITRGKGHGDDEGGLWSDHVEDVARGNEERNNVERRLNNGMDSREGREF